MAFDDQPKTVDNDKADLLKELSDRETELLHELAEISKERAKLLEQ